MAELWSDSYDDHAAPYFTVATWLDEESFLFCLRCPRGRHTIDLVQHALFA